MFDTFERPETFTSHNGDKAPLPFSQAEYDRRLTTLREIMGRHDLAAVVLTSMHNVAYYSGFLYCAFGRPYACVVTHDACTTVSAITARHRMPLGRRPGSRLPKLEAVDAQTDQ